MTDAEDYAAIDVAEYISVVHLVFYACIYVMQQYLGTKLTEFFSAVILKGVEALAEILETHWMRTFWRSTFLTWPIAGLTARKH